MSTKRIRFTSPSVTKPLKVLVDLKPALDGYSGIPQESRLLFAALLGMSNQFEVEGLIQHGSRLLQPNVKPHRNKQPFDYADLSAITSFNARPRARYPQLIRNHLERISAQVLVRTQALVGLRQTPYRLASQHHPDFIWHTLFSKSLASQDLNKVTQAPYKIIRTPKKHYFSAGLLAYKWGLKPRFPKLNTQAHDVLIAQTPYPARISPNTQLVVRYHDAIPLLMPHTIKDNAFHQASHYHALARNVKDGAWFVCVSESSRQDLLKFFPEAESRANVIYDIVSDAYFDEDTDPSCIGQIIRKRLHQPQGIPKPLVAESVEYLLMVSTLEPRKNHLLLVSAWEQLKESGHPNLKLVIVGNPGWDYKSILDAFKPWQESGDLYHLTNVPADELRKLYKHAQVTVCPSLAEGFDYSGVEAMNSGGIVAASDIPVHREVYKAASTYFNPYDKSDAATAISQLLKSSNEERLALKATGKQLGSHYQRASLGQQWQAFLHNTFCTSNSV